MTINGVIASDVAALQTAVGAVPVLADATLVQLRPVAVAAAATLADIAANVATVEATIDMTKFGGVPSVSVNMPAPQLAAALLAQTQAVLDLTMLENLKGYVGRIQANIANAPG